MIFLDIEYQPQYFFIYLKYFFFSIFGAIIIGIIPVTVQYLLLINRQYKKTLKDAGILDTVNDSWEEDVRITAGNSKNKCVFNPQNVHYISSDENYITIFLFNKELLSKTIIRGTLRSVESELNKCKLFIRCHNRYIVNVKHVNRSVGNSQNFRLILNKSEIEIPVSRSKVSSILKIIPKN